MPSLFREISETDFAEHKRKQEAQYSKYNLKKNPFPLGGNFPEGYIAYTFLTKTQEEGVRDFLVSTFFRGEFNGMIILGEYGTGKSHLLNYIHETINADEDGIFGGQALSFIVQNPSVAPEDILISLLRMIQLETMQDLIFLPIRRSLNEEFGNNLWNFLREFSDFQPNNQIGILEQNDYEPSYYKALLSGGFREFRDILDDNNIKLDNTKIREYSKRVLTQQEISDNPIIIDSLLDLISSSASKDVHIWENFLVKNFLGKNSKVVGIEFYLRAILRLFKIMGIQHLYLLVDELEDLRTQRLSKKAATEYLATLRRMIQASSDSFSLVLASARDAWNELKLYYPAIEDRFPVTVELIRGPDDVKQVIANYLKEERIDNAGNPSNVYFPFSEPALDCLIEMRGITLRHIVSECRRLIDLGVAEKVELPISSEFVENAIRNS